MPMRNVSRQTIILNEWRIRFITKSFVIIEILNFTIKVNH